MRVLSKALDKRINSVNFFLETTFEEFISFAPKLLRNNEFQRMRVRTSRTVYSLLKDDLKQGCIIPPIVLAARGSVSYCESDDILKYIQDNTKDILILDGLQRTFTLIDAAEEVSKDEKAYEAFKRNIIRLEFYVDINKFGILYRMLTLNTGQTPMSARHQIEILYSDLLNTEIDGIELITDVEGKADPNENQFVFKNVIDGFNSYLSQSALPIDRQDILDNISMLEKMSEESFNKDIFCEFIHLYLKVYHSLRQCTNDYVLSDNDLSVNGISSSPFGKSVCKVFSSSQALTGFGSAIAKLKEFKLISNFSDIEDVLVQIEVNNSNSLEWLFDMLLYFDKIKNTSKKIGNAQRLFFQYFFRELFNKESDSYLNLGWSVTNGYQKYNNQVN